MGDPNLSNLLKWGLANSGPSKNNGGPESTGITMKSDSEPQPNTTTAISSSSSASAGGPRGLKPDALAALFGGPSEAELMQSSMAAVVSPEVPIDEKLVAFDNFEQLVESLDNANLLSKLGLWTPLLEQLSHDNAEIRRMAAWCIGTAVQNNEKCQERLIALGGVEKLVAIAVDGSEEKAVRKKAIYALSSAVRNYEPSMNVTIKELVKLGRQEDEGIDAADMEAVDEVFARLREEVNGLSGQ